MKLSKWLAAIAPLGKAKLVGFVAGSDTEPPSMWLETKHNEVCVILNDDVSPERIARIREALGL